MNDQELFDNFSRAACRWAVENGTRPLPGQALFSAHAVNQSVTIDQWLHDSPEPTTAQLKAYTAQQVLDTEIELERDVIIDPSLERDTKLRWYTNIGEAWLGITDQLLSITRTALERRTAMASLYRSSEHS